MGLPEVMPTELCARVAFARAGKPNGVLSGGLLAGVVEGVAGEGYVATVVAGYADCAVEELTAADVDALTAFEFQ